MFFSLDSTRYLSPYACTRSSTAGDAATPAMKEESKCVRVCIEGSFIIRVTYYEAIVDQQIPELLLLKHLEKEQTLRKAALGGEWEEGVSRCDMPDSHMSFFLSFFLSFSLHNRSAPQSLDLTYMTSFAYLGCCQYLRYSR